MRQLPYDAGAVHQQEDCIKLTGKRPIEQIDAVRILHPLPTHRLHGERRDVDGCDRMSLLLQSQRMTPTAGTYIKEATVTALQRNTLNFGHLLETAKKLGDGYLILIELRGEDTKFARLPMGEVIGDGSSHRIPIGR